MIRNIEIRHNKFVFKEKLIIRIKKKLLKQELNKSYTKKSLSYYKRGEEIFILSLVFFLSLIILH